ncbi:peptide/nickel transport system ATP-binding protein/oligopeptide transport system ATP-binding protein [Kribbella rubisoli]|uniref:Peptide/nickel transport system ATP-binding protein/oligopeptide transport system ATP-binding protein n=1 Tax=Kribbella rubisoli TaxID=3075929 RepID=A0A4Q7XBX2_9ACTN|nr:ABC transporter ATP-binding protein [Kribbella rubisoli]RZU20611.1 peptide/nickel transport system ATP-binding protein/oligopeptide transport system ATP-binding protein [Kribbella rubisoli]
MLEVRDLRVTFGPRRKPFVAVDGVSLTVGANETVGLVGESGSGKTTVARSIVGLVRPASGSITYDGRAVPAGTSRPGELQRAIQMVFQDPRSSLNPWMTVASIIGEAWRTHPSAASDLDRLLADVGLDSSVAGQRASQLSGGQCQRVSLARALAVKPRLLVCDEAVSALDVSVQAQILRLLDDLRRRHNLSMLFISHDLGVVHQIADRIAVMRRGVLVEEGPATDVLGAPQHEYTQSLLDAALELNS